MIRKHTRDYSYLLHSNLVEDLINLSIKNQAHKNDILLVLTCGQYDEDEAKVSKFHVPGYITGFQFERYSTISTTRFIKWYCEESGFVINEDDLPKMDVRGDMLIRASIGVESMIYLSFWENDITLMKLYQLSRLATGQRYDWHWREKLLNTKNRNEFFRKDIKNIIKDVSPNLYDFYDKYVVGQVRNAIAHSQLAPLNNEIKLLNYSEDPKKYSPKINIQYSEWEEMICATLSFRARLVSSLNDLIKMNKDNFPNNKFNTEITIEDKTVKASFKFP